MIFLFHFFSFCFCFYSSIERCTTIKKMIPITISTTIRSHFIASITNTHYIEQKVPVTFTSTFHTFSFMSRTIKEETLTHTNIIIEKKNRIFHSFTVETIKAPDPDVFYSSKYIGQVIYQSIFVPIANPITKIPLITETVVEEEIKTITM